MREIIVLGGSGSGKTSLSLCMAHLASDPVLCDLNPEIPDLSRSLSPAILESEPVLSGGTASIITDQCIHCLSCVRLCRQGAVIPQGPQIDPDRCEGCGVCANLCPAMAIELTVQEIGKCCLSRTRFGSLAHAELVPGSICPDNLVSVLKGKGRACATSSDAAFLIGDGSSKNGSAAVSAISGAHLAVLVISPSSAALQDFERLTRLCSHFRIPSALVISQWDLQPDITARLEKLSAEKKCLYAGRIPFSPIFTKATQEGKAVTEFASPEAEAIRNIVYKLLAAAQEQCPHH